MKGPLVFLLLLLSLAIASWQFACKIRRVTDPIDLAEKGVHGLEDIVPAGAKISYYSVNVPFQHPFWLRYSLAPRHLSLDENRPYDTALVVSTGIPDSFLANRQIIWQNVDSQYHYFLTCSKH